MKEELKVKYQPKKVVCLKLQEPYRSDSKTLARAFELTERSERQTKALMAYLQLDKKQEFIRKQDIYNLVNVDKCRIEGHGKKGYCGVL